MQVCSKKLLGSQKVMSKKMNVKIAKIVVSKWIRSQRDLMHSQEWKLYSTREETVKIITEIHTARVLQKWACNHQHLKELPNSVLLSNQIIKHPNLIKEILSFLIHLTQDTKEVRANNSWVQTNHKAIITISKNHFSKLALISSLMNHWLWVRFLGMIARVMQKDK